MEIIVTHLHPPVDRTWILATAFEFRMYGAALADLVFWKGFERHRCIWNEEEHDFVIAADNMVTDWSKEAALLFFYSQQPKQICIDIYSILCLVTYFIGFFWVHKIIFDTGHDLSCRTLQYRIISKVIQTFWDISELVDREMQLQWVTDSPSLDPWGFPASVHNIVRASVARAKVHWNFII